MEMFWNGWVTVNKLRMFLKCDTPTACIMESSSGAQTCFLVAATVFNGCYLSQKNDNVTKSHNSVKNLPFFYPRFSDSIARLKCVR